MYALTLGFLVLLIRMEHIRFGIKTLEKINGMCKSSFNNLIVYKWFTPSSLVVQLC